MFALATSGPEGPSDAIGVGLVLASVGGFLLANSIVFRHPRTLLAEFFGGQRGKLTSIRGYIFHRLQIHLGFLFLLLGFGFQLYGHYYRPDLPATASGLEAGVETGFPLSWVGFVLVAVGVLEVGGWLLSHALFRRYLREYFRVNPPDLETDMALTRELGDLFGIPSTGDDTVQSYLTRVRRAVGLEGVPGGSPISSGSKERLPAGSPAYVGSGGKLGSVRVPGDSFRSMGPEEGLV